MVLQRAVYVARKVAQYGVVESVSIGARKMSAAYYELYWRRAVERNTAHTTWQQFVTLHRLPENGTPFVATVQTALHLSASDIVPDTYVDEEIIAHADQLCTIVDLLGSGPVAYTSPPWHTDIRARAQATTNDYQFDAHLFYKDIVIPYGTDTSLGKDIKLPWELSRLQHLVVIAYAYARTSNDYYANVCVTQILDWIEKNPFMRGVNWVCPMDVGLRAVSIVWVLQLLTGAPACTPDVVQRITASLHDHAVYLECNWELYDGRTSNHYLSNLIGYYYICYFFKALPAYRIKAAWCLQQIIKELDKQVFDDGTHYEGSTQYHRLVAELFYHAALVSRAFGFILADDTLTKIDRMLHFIKTCTPEHGRLIMLGDHDSGKVAYWNYVKNLHRKTHISCNAVVQKYVDFGVVVVRKGPLHLSFKEQVVAQRQPSGHMHNDALSCTLSYGKHEILADPGSFVYTPSSVERNYFRSYTAHSTFGIAGYEPVVFDDRIFFLALPESRSTLSVTESGDEVVLYAYHDLYARFGVRAHRELTVDSQQATVTFVDWLSVLDAADDLSSLDNFFVAWNFTLAPECVPVRDGSDILIMIAGEHVARIQSECELFMQSGYVSRAYGSKEETTCIRAHQKLEIGKKVTTVIQFH